MEFINFCWYKIVAKLNYVYMYIFIFASPPWIFFCRRLWLYYNTLKHQDWKLHKFQKERIALLMKNKILWVQNLDFSDLWSLLDQTEKKLSSGSIQGPLKVLIIVLWCLKGFRGALIRSHNAERRQSLAQLYVWTL